MPVRSLSAGSRGAASPPHHDSRIALTLVDTATTGWGPAGHRAAFSLSFDNLGEAAALQRGERLQPSLMGNDPTAAFVPRLLELLGDVPATYFIEASNVARYPEAILAWHRAGQEVGLHAWQHEHWARLEASARQALLSRSLQAMATLGIQPTGFRPPGGVMPDAALAELSQAGMLYCSPLGAPGHSHIDHVLVQLPFAWRHVDAYMLDPTLGALRERHGDARTPQPPAQWRLILERAIQQAIAQRQHLTVIFHSYLLLQAQERLDILQWLLQTLRAAPDLWVAPCTDVAHWLRRTHATSVPRPRQGQEGVTPFRPL